MDKYEHGVDNKAILSSYDTFLDHLYKHNNQTIDRLN